ncbi:3-deoxy-manno-octulosonate cytidylyltransferase [Motilimonas eburnea]|uniref:3-deoxy-manno-octulosonate cytidylyltransferase n=1 Tax=Motilimonas eburnea TaxID=1737488 RepID=UPI001E5A3836|nr:3-deoxy-manno-octulosonate cytidylyltransferase [Motilimonas eburnea]MCE2572508.1 3-deoxy-manno-octulosonate cytidylyltransferase [Motilimonas eburnea]
MSFIVVIPARYQSERLPGKPLLELGGKPMIAHVVDRARESGAARIIVATDDARIADMVDCEVCMTRRDHQSGTERLAEVVEQCGFDENDVIVNVQGDEPMIPPSIIKQVAKNLAEQTLAPMATLATHITSIEEALNPNAVKVVTDKNGYALYFSRASIPWQREHFPEQLDSEHALLRHIGIYAYRAGFIQRYIGLSESPLEGIEKLEQLRVLWHGEKIHLAIAEQTPVAGIDTQEDYLRVKQHLG